MNNIIDVYWIRCSRTVGKAESLACRAAIWKQRYQNEPPAVVTDANGKPRFAQGKESFSVSHSGRYYVVAFCPRGELGLDVEERVGEGIRMEAIGQRFFSKEEQEAVRTASDPRAVFTRLWTQKEARVKYTGEGLGAIRHEPDAATVCRDISRELQQHTENSLLFGALVYQGEYRIRIQKGNQP